MQLSRWQAQGATGRPGHDTRQLKNGRLPNSIPSMLLVDERAGPDGGSSRSNGGASSSSSCGDRNPPACHAPPSARP